MVLKKVLAFMYWWCIILVLKQTRVKQWNMNSILKKYLHYFLIKV
ncbi:hypothetical protein [Salmonella phage PHA46]